MVGLIGSQLTHDLSQIGTWKPALRSYLVKPQRTNVPVRKHRSSNKNGWTCAKSTRLFHPTNSKIPVALQYIGSSYYSVVSHFSSRNSV